MIFWVLAIASKKHNPPSPKIYFCHLWISPCCYNPYLRHIKAESVVTTTSPNVMACVKVAKSLKHLWKKIYFYLGFSYSDLSIRSRVSSYISTFFLKIGSKINVLYEFNLPLPRVRITVFKRNGCNWLTITRPNLGLGCSTFVILELLRNLSFPTFETFI